MAEKRYRPGENYDYPLIIKKLLQDPLIKSPNREIVYADRHRYTYKDLEHRIGRLANGLTDLGAAAGDTIAVFDYDSHRYLECFFAIPMIGAVLQTVNWRLSAAQIAYTLNHAEAKMVVINADFLPVLENIWDKLETVKTVVVIAENGGITDTKIGPAAEFEELMQSSSASFEFPDLGENTKATTFYTTGTTGNPKGVHFTHRQLVLHTLAVAVECGAYHTTGRFRSNDVYMPLTPMFHVHAWGFPYVATLLGAKQIYPGQYEPDKAVASHRKRKSYLFALCADYFTNAADQSNGQRSGSVKLEGYHWRRPTAKRPCQSSSGSWHRNQRRLRDVGNRPGDDDRNPPRRHAGLGGR